mmetsp:Transcript_16439/g.30997  ORF Transcript_16439/g.30997 Transcript_16439/m.30997 type:complete len:107 (+) Transcript_16439:36-356(+)
MADVKRTLGEEFEVMLSSAGKWRLGAFTFKEHNGLRIAAIHSTGAISDWNKAHPEKQVKAGDLLVEIDAQKPEGGLRGSGKELYEELLKVPRPCRLVMGAGPLHTG